MADFTTTYAVSTTEVPVTCHIDGAVRISVQENYNSATPATADLLQRGRIQGATQINIAKGTPAVFASGPYSLGEQVGTIATASGSITVSQTETKTV